MSWTFLTLVYSFRHGRAIKVVNQPNSLNGRCALPVPRVEPWKSHEMHYSEQIRAFLFYQLRTPLIELPSLIKL